MTNVELSIVKAAEFPEIPAPNTLYLVRDPLVSDGLLIGVSDNPDPPEEGASYIYRTPSGYQRPMNYVQGFELGTQWTTQIDDKLTLRFECINDAPGQLEFKADLIVAPVTSYDFNCRVATVGTGLTVTCNQSDAATTVDVTEAVSSSIKGQMQSVMEAIFINRETMTTYKVTAFANKAKILFVKIETMTT